MTPFVEMKTEVLTSPKNGKGNGSPTRDVISSPFEPTIVPLLGAVSAAGAPVVTIYGSATSAATVTLTLAVLVLPTLSVKRIDNCPIVCLKGMLTKVDVPVPGR